MRAAILDKHGAIDSLRIGELDPPKVAADTILVRVVAAAINPADFKVVHGKDEVRSKSHPANRPPAEKQTVIPKNSNAKTRPRKLSDTLRCQKVVDETHRLLPPMCAKTTQSIAMVRLCASGKNT